MAHPDFDALLNALFPQAREMLAKHGEFHPFAAYVTTDDKVAFVAAHSGEDHLEARKLLALLVRGLQQYAAQGKAKATGICVDVQTTPPGQTEKVDAACAQMEHANGEAIEVFLPYRKSDSGEIEYSELFAAPGGRLTFAGKGTE